MQVGLLRVVYEARDEKPINIVSIPMKRHERQLYTSVFRDPGSSPTSPGGAHPSELRPSTEAGAAPPSAAPIPPNHETLKAGAESPSSVGQIYSDSLISSYLMSLQVGGCVFVVLKGEHAGRSLRFQASFTCQVPANAGYRTSCLSANRLWDMLLVVLHRPAWWMATNVCGAWLQIDMASGLLQALQPAVVTLVSSYIAATRKALLVGVTDSNTAMASAQVGSERPVALPCNTSGLYGGFH